MAAEIDTPRNSRTDYDKKIAYKLAVASDCAYRLEGMPKEKESVLECLKESKVNNYQNLKEGDVRAWEAKKYLMKCDNKGIDAYVLINTDNALILAIRGTLPPIFYDSKSDSNFISDWKNNFAFEMRHNRQDMTNYHSGFMNSWECIKEGLQNEDYKKFLETNLNDQKKFYITGHSKGGAIAIIAAIKFLEGGTNWPIKNQPNAIYTFSAPRPFTANDTRDYVDKYGSNLKALLSRLEYKIDLVPLMPPDQVFYEHITSNKFTDLINNFVPLPKASALFIPYNSFDLGRLFYVDVNNDLYEIESDEQNQNNQAKRRKEIFSAYSFGNLLKSDVIEYARYLPYDIMKVKPQLCFEIVNNHQAHTSYLRKIVIENKPEPAEKIHSDWDEYCTIKSIFDTGKADFLKRVYQLIDGLDKVCKFDLHNKFRINGLC